MEMTYRTAGRTGVKVSSLCLGTMTFGREASEDESKEIIGHALDAGVNFFDTADVYAQGRSEEILGRAISGVRDELVLVSKCGGKSWSGPNAGGGSRRNITRSVEASLRRLQTDRLDFYLLHRFDPLVPLDDTLSALDDLVRRGLVLYVGASNFAAWQYMKAMGTSDRHGLERFALIQPMYNLLKRQAEVEIFPMACNRGFGRDDLQPARWWDPIRQVP